MTGLFDFINQTTILMAIKWMIVSGLILYSFFGFLISKQIQVMNKAVSTQYGKFIYQLGLIHFLSSILVVIIAIVIL